MKIIERGGWALNRENKLAPGKKKQYEENISGAFTRESYTTYSDLCKQRKSNIRNVALYLVIAGLLAASALVFAISIRKAFFEKGAENPGGVTEGLNTGKSNFEENHVIKVELLTDEKSVLYNVPCGVRIEEIKEQSVIFEGLKKDDVITEVSGKKVKTLQDIYEAIESISEEELLYFTVYRNEEYRTISPFSE